MVIPLIGAGVWGPAWRNPNRWCCHADAVADAGQVNDLWGTVGHPEWDTG